MVLGKADCVVFWRSLKVMTLSPEDWLAPFTAYFQHKAQQSDWFSYLPMWSLICLSLDRCHILKYMDREASEARKTLSDTGINSPQADTIQFTDHVQWGKMGRTQQSISKSAHGNKIGPNCDSLSPTHIWWSPIPQVLGRNQSLKHMEEFFGFVSLSFFLSVFLFWFFVTFFHSLSSFS